MFRSRAVQYLGLALLMLACLAIIFYPVGARPEPRRYTINLTASKPFQQLAGAGKQVSEVADQALLREFKAGSGERLPPGSLTVLADGKTATIEDEAATRPEAQRRARRIVQALQKPFSGVAPAPQTQANIADFPPQPLAALGHYAIFPYQRDTAIKLGLDLRGGVNLVLQVRRALFTYNFNKKLGSDPDARDQFATQVRNALAQAPAGVNLGEADVNLASGQGNVLEVRTQAKDRAQFDAQRKAILQVLNSGVQGVKFTETREPQFFQPDESVGQGLGLRDNYSAELLNRTVEIVRSRVDKLGVSEPQIQAQPPDRIVVQLPGINDPQRAIDVVGTTAQMEIRLLPADLVPVPDPADPSNTLFRDQKGNAVAANAARLRSELIVSGRDVKPTTTVGFADANEPAIFFELQGEGSRRFAEVTRRVQNPNHTPGKDRFIPIFLDERVISAPRVESAITGGRGQISGGFKNVEEARELALLLNSGALPAPIDVVENRTVSATLGTDSLVKSLRAGLIGLLMVAIFMIAFYRLAGVLANCALIVYCVLNLAVFILIGGTLTLPGIAGFLLAIAMSLDTNILVFERLKEEMRIQPTFAAALRAAFSRAWTAILDSHVTTLIAAVILFYFGTGPVKGFALTLGVGVLLSLFSAISVTRLFMWSVAGLGQSMPTLFNSGLGTARELAPESK
jgi:SecD/SecF fusion protein